MENNYNNGRGMMMGMPGHEGGGRNNKKEASSKMEHSSSCGHSGKQGMNGAEERSAGFHNQMMGGRQEMMQGGVGYNHGFFGLGYFSLGEFVFWITLVLVWVWLVLQIVRSMKALFSDRRRSDSQASLPSTDLSKEK